MIYRCEDCGKEAAGVDWPVSSNLGPDVLTNRRCWICGGLGYLVPERLPRSRSIRPRPVWNRHLTRIVRNINEIPPPTEIECRDALRVLAERRGEVDANDPLEMEAFNIFVEAGK